MSNFAKWHYLCKKHEPKDILSFKDLAHQVSTWSWALISNSYLKSVGLISAQMTSTQALSSGFPVAWNPAWSRLTSRCPRTPINPHYSFRNLNSPSKAPEAVTSLAASLHSCKNWRSELGNIRQAAGTEHSHYRKLSGYRFTFYDMLPIDWQTLVETFNFKTTIFFPLEKQSLTNITFLEVWLEKARLFPI